MTQATVILESFTIYLSQEENYTFNLGKIYRVNIGKINPASVVYPYNFSGALHSALCDSLNGLDGDMTSDAYYIDAATGTAMNTMITIDGVQYISSINNFIVSRNALLSYMISNQMTINLYSQAINDEYFVHTSFKARIDFNDKEYFNDDIQKYLEENNIQENDF